MSGEMALNWPVEMSHHATGYEVGSIWREARMPNTHEIAALVWGDLPTWMPTPIRPAVEWPWPQVRLHPGLVVPGIGGDRPPAFVAPVYGRRSRGPATTLAVAHRSRDLTRPADPHTESTVLRGEGSGFTLRRGDPLGGTIILTAGLEAWLWWSMMSIRPVWATTRWGDLSEVDLEGVTTVLLVPDRWRRRDGIDATTDMLSRRYAGRVRVEPIWTPEEAGRWGLLNPAHVALRPLYGRDGW